MSLQDEVFDALRDAGLELKEDLWSAKDKEVLAQRAKDLVGLHVKALAADDPGKKEQYRLAARLVVQHVQLIALTRLHVAGEDLVEIIKKFFTRVLLPALLRLLPALF